MTTTCNCRNQSGLCGHCATQAAAMTCRECSAEAEFSVTVNHHRPHPDGPCQKGTFAFCGAHLAGLVLDGAFVILHNQGRPCPRCGGPAETIGDLFTATSV